MKSITMDRVAFVLENASFLQILSVFEWKKVVLDLPYKNKVQFYTRTSTNGPNLQLFLVENASNGSKQEALVAGLKAIQVNTVISLLQSAHQESSSIIIPYHIGAAHAVLSNPTKSFTPVSKESRAWLMNLLTQEDQVTEIEQVIYVAGTCVSNELVSYFSTIFKDVTVAAGLYSEEVTTVPVVLPSSSAVEAFVKNVIKYLETRTCALSIMTANSRKIPADLIVFAGKIVPVVPSGIILEDHAVVVKDGNILDLLPREDALEKYTPVEISDLDHHILIPGLVNAHTHAAMTLLRGLSDDKPLCTWLAEDIWPAESKFVDPTFVKDGMLHAGAEMIRCGTTCFNDMYFFPEDTCEQLEEIGLRGVIGQIVFEFPTSYGKGPDDYLLKAKVMLDKYKGSELIRMSVAPHTPYTVSEMSMAKANELSKEYNVPIHIHVHETLAECHDSEILNRDSMNCHISEEKCRPLVNYKRLGFLSERLVCVHMTQLTDEEIASLAESGTHVVHCPSSNLKLASGICPITKLFAAGINVAIGTDGAASNNTLDMFSEMKLAAILAKGESMEATSIPAMVALQMATLNGAKALGLEKRIGSIEVGKSADLVAVSTDNIEMIPMYNAISHLVYVAGRENVSDVWVHGRRLLRHRELTTMDESIVKEKVSTWHDAIRDFHQELEKKN